MKTLKDLKENASKYEWALLHNSWYKTIPDFQASPRRVKRVQSTKLSLLTKKEGVETESWIDFPKASELTLKPCELSSYELTITRESHVMKYRLTPIQELF